MIAVAQRRKAKAASVRQNDLFISMLPQIVDQAEYAFRQVPAGVREELVQESLAQAYAMFVRLCHRGKTSLSPTPRPLQNSPSATSAPAVEWALRAIVRTSCHLVPVRRRGSSSGGLTALIAETVLGVNRWLRTTRLGRPRSRRPGSIFTAGFRRYRRGTGSWPKRLPWARRRAGWRACSGFPTRG